MSDGVAQMNPTQREQDEDDWETADIATFAQPKQAVKASGPGQGSLRPSAPAFVPRPAPGPSQAKSLYEPKPSGNSSRQDGADDEWFGSRRPVSNRQIWESANKAGPATVIAPSPMHAEPGTVGAQLPPAPVMQILRRPQDASGNTGRRTTPGGTGTKTLEKREEEYRLARERIFGPSAPGSDQPSGSSGGGHRSGSGTPTGGRSKGGSPQPGFVGTGFGEGGMGFGAKRSPGPGLGERKTSSPGIVRQPKGPSEGGGFGR